ncbi:MAG TPA: PaaI family thioesterase [Actinomycetota bacterium]|nr:PaaI family thioesterase [Actinomycetota bacterium]
MTTPDRPWWQLVLEGRADEREMPPPRFVRELGIEPAGWEPGVARLRWKPPAWTRVPLGWVQGGILGVPLDMAQSFAIVTLAPEWAGAVTLDMRLTYLEPAYPDEYLVEGRVTRMGKTAAHTEGTVTDMDGRVICTSVSAALVKTYGPRP